MLRYRAEITSPLNAPRAKSAAIDWLQAIGYRAVSPSFLSSIRFERGSWRGNAASLNPSQWRCALEIECRPANSGSSVILAYEVTTAGQTCTRADIEFFTAEIESVLQAVFGHPNDLESYRRLLRRAQTGDVWRALLFTVALLGPILVGMFGAVPFWQGIVAGVVIGSACYWAIRAPRRLDNVRVPPPAPEGI